MKEDIQEILLKNTLIEGSDLIFKERVVIIIKNFIIIVDDVIKRY